MGKTWHHRLPPAAALALICLVDLLLQHAAADKWSLANSREGNVLTLILTDCSPYQDWQTIAAAFAWRRSGQEGSIVRVANCNPEDTENYSKKMLDYVQTHMAPLYAHNEELDDWYQPYNKPGAVLEYFKHNNPKQEWVVVLDPDMLLHKAFQPKDLPLERGWAYAAHYDYLIGTNNALAARHIPEVAPRNDTKAGQVGRRGDQVGTPYYMHRDDLRKLAPQWLNYTKIVRTDLEAHKDSGDVASKEGERIWIAEMYGYSFGAAKSGVWHTWGQDYMLYPTYTPQRIPRAIHYGLQYNVDSWAFNKYSYLNFDPHKCTPWDLDTEKPQAGIFPPPPGPANLTGGGADLYTTLIAVSVISTVNAALCDYHVRNCPPSAQLTSVCNEAFKLYHAVDQAIKNVEWDWDCTDRNKECKAWAERGECTAMKDYMHSQCNKACGGCMPRGPRPVTEHDELMTVEKLSREVEDVEVIYSTSTTQQLQQHQRPAHDEGDMQKRFKQSTLGFTGLIRRCLDLQGLNDDETKDCVKAAGYDLEYSVPAATAETVKAVEGAAVDTAQSIGGAADDKTTETNRAAARYGLAMLRMQQINYTDEVLQEQLGCRMTTNLSGWRFIEQLCVVTVVIEVMYIIFSRLLQYGEAQAKQHKHSD